MWIFGYGSLIWKIDFPYEEKILGYIKGYHRRFYQHSTDHRGTPENEKVYGIAYRIKKSDIDYVVKHLDFREKGGYERKTVMFYPCDQEQKPFEMVIYLANHDNFNYAGSAELSEIAKQVVKSVGPSGPNIDYVCNLAKAMRVLFPEVYDEHLFNLEKMVLDLSKNNICNASAS
ncbi:unnamed protein product [Acanthoscelides obtectus]|uniref:glutathione-specific gamma-glutamylcyclotransferase n=1 Tax=Acanthoscelides obtectus TaxID=200917 RepID=A0A9P0PDD7_ACAOB|nr:unnamed protein product [Acanthoscelides obtectus]CAK1640157.1 Putative glutathione-specific gamma-glutamylcyclotransferase 2 [Acanthoscelides obtectus]